MGDRHDVVYAEANSNLYTCTQIVAMGDGEDIKSCKVIRKLDVGEFFEASGPVVEDSESQVSRLPGKALKDGKDGWVTLRGNDEVLLCEERGRARETFPKRRRRKHSKHGCWRNLPVVRRPPRREGPTRT